MEITGPQIRPRVPVGEIAALLGLIVLAIGEIAAIKITNLGGDFRETFYLPARAVVHGQFPYGRPGSGGLLRGSVYPPSAFGAFAWLGLLPWRVAVMVWLALEVALAVGTLRVLGVRDPRCYALWLLTPLILSTLAAGNGTVLVIFLVALAWRYRDQPWFTAAALVCAIAIKLYAVPLIFWLLLTKRYRAALLVGAGAPLVIVAAWAAIGFEGMRGYPALLSANTRVFGWQGPFLQSLVQQLGGSGQLALGIGVTAAGALIIAARNRSDVATFALVACAVILATPVAWVGMLGLLVIPISAVWDHLSRAWVLLLVGSYAHWYITPLPYRSVELSVFTLGLMAAVASGILARSTARS